MASHSLIPIPAKKNGTLNQKTAPKSFSPLVMILSVPANKIQPQKPPQKNQLATAYPN
jgi:hypothetical protein